MVKNVLRACLGLSLCLGSSWLLCSYRGGFAAPKNRAVHGLMVYILDTGVTTKLRSAPKGSVVMQLPAGRRYRFEVEAVRNGWWRLADNQEIVTNDKPDVEYRVSSPTWVHYSLLTLTTNNAHRQWLTLYARPNERAEGVYSFQGEIQIHPLEVRGEWCRVQTLDKKYTGWLQRRWLSAHPAVHSI